MDGSGNQDLYLADTLQAELNANLQGSETFDPNMATVMPTNFAGDFEFDPLANYDFLNDDFDFSNIDGIQDDQFLGGLIDPALQNDELYELPLFPDQVELQSPPQVTDQHSTSPRKVVQSPSQEYGQPQPQQPRQVQLSSQAQPQTLHQSPPRQYQSPPKQSPPKQHQSPPQQYRSPSGQYVQPHQYVQSQQPSQAQPGLSALPQQSAAPYSEDPNPYASLYHNHDPYQPQVYYPAQGIDGHQGALNIPSLPPVQDEKVSDWPPTLDTLGMASGLLANLSAQPAAATCMSCGRMPHYGLCPQPAQVRRQAVPLAVMGLAAKSAPKRSWMDESEDDQTIERPAKVAKKNGKSISRLTTRGPKAKKAATKDPRADIFPYPVFGGAHPWLTAGGLQISYLPEGQLDEDILFTAKDLREYLDQCPRPLNIWLQNCPSKCKGRLVDADMKCRYSECPTKFGTILHGWHRVAFDEFPDMTTGGTKDPYKMAGVMHLWCFEQCFDPLEFFEKDQMFPDARLLPHETHNRMAITRDDYKNVIPRAIKPWVRERRSVGISKAPYQKHEDTLSWRLCDFHVKHQNVAREKCRDKRNAERPDDERKTIEIIMGDLSKYVSRDKLAKTRAKTRRTNDVLKEPWQQRTPAPSVPLSDEDFQVLMPLKVPNTANTVRALTPQSVGSQIQDSINVSSLAPIQTDMSPSSLFAPSPSMGPKVQDNINVAEVPTGQSFPSSLFGSSPPETAAPAEPERAKMQVATSTTGRGQRRPTSAPDSQRSPLRRFLRSPGKRNSY